jgi:hypothetical protein
MAYRAKVTFADLQDGKRLYHEGETFPRDGLTVSDERLAYLSGSGNLMGYPLIVKVDEELIEEPEKPVRRGRRKDAD